VITLTRSIYLDPTAGLGTFEIFGGKMFVTGTASITLLAFYYGSALSLEFQQLVYVHDIFFSDHLHTGSGTTAHLFWVLQDSGWAYLRAFNLKFYSKNGNSSAGVYIAGDGSGFDSGTASKRFKVFENCSFYVANANALGMYMSTGSTYLYAMIKNCVVWSAAGGGFPDYLYTDNAGISFVNSADSDNSIASQDTDTVHGITGADFISVDPTSADFLKIADTSSLFAAGSAAISAWNTLDLAGNPRPSALGDVSIGAYEIQPIATGDSLLDLGNTSEIFTLRPNWMDLPSAGVENGREVIQFNMGYGSIRSLTENDARCASYGYFLKSKAEEFYLLNFFNGQRGRLKRFWLPVYYQEFTIDAPITYGSFKFTIVDNGFTTVAKFYERLYIELKNGNRISRKITSADSATVFNVLSQFDRDIAVSDIRMAGLLLLVRFDQDELSLAHVSDSLSESSINFLELPKEYDTIANDS
jgi:hypothetical protein